MRTVECGHERRFNDINSKLERNAEFVSKVQLVCKRAFYRLTYRV